MNRTRMRLIPPTREYCWVNIVVGAILVVTSLVVLTSAGVAVPALEIVLVILGLAMMATGVIGLANPTWRDRLFRRR